MGHVTSSSVQTTHGDRPHHDHSHSSGITWSAVWGGATAGGGLDLPPVFLFLQRARFLTRPCRLVALTCPAPLCYSYVFSRTRFFRMAAHRGIFSRRPDGHGSRSQGL